MDALISPPPGGPSQLQQLQQQQQQQQQQQTLSPAYGSMPIETITAACTAHERLLYRARKTNIIQKTRSGRASHAESSHALDALFASIMQNDGAKRKPKLAVNLPPIPVMPDSTRAFCRERGIEVEADVAWQISGAFHQQTAGLIAEAAEAVTEHADAGFEEIMAGQRDATKRVDAQFKQAQEQSKRANIQQSTALSKIQKGSTEILEDTTEIKGILNTILAEMVAGNSTTSTSAIVVSSSNAGTNDATLGGDTVLPPAPVVGPSIAESINGSLASESTSIASAIDNGATLSAPSVADPVPLALTNIAGTADDTKAVGAEAASAYIIAPSVS